MTRLIQYQRFAILVLGISLSWNLSQSYVVGFSTTSRSIRVFQGSRPLSTATLKNVNHRESSRQTSLSALPPVTPWVLAHVVAGAAGTPVVVGAIGKTKDGWYKRIPKPSWTPPDGAFAPAWTTLYTLMGIAAGRIYGLWKTTNVATTKTAAGTALVYWGLHIFLNLIWAPVFFGFKRLRLGGQLNVVLVASLTAIIPMFYRLLPITGLLLVPYWFWLVFATALNLTVCKMNPTDADGFSDAKFQDKLIRLQKQAAVYAFSESS